MHKPLKGDFNEILAAIALGKGKAKRVAPKVGEKEMNTFNHPQVQTRLFFRVLAGCLSLLMFATALIFIYFAITEGSWLAWLFGLVEILGAVGFAGGALTGNWFRFRK
jgi:hypothetical protein